MGVRSLIFWAGLLGLSIATARATEREFTRTFAVEPGCSLKLDTHRGRITIVESDEPEVRVAVQMDIGTDNEEEAERAFAALELSATAADNTVTLRARNPRETRVRFAWNDKLQIDLSWRITVPRQCNVEVATITGGITVGNLTGRVVARTEAGTIYLKRIDGSIDATVDAGDVVVSRCSGPVKIRVRQGLIRVGTINGPGDLKNSAGDIEVLAARAGITASAEAGDVSVGFPRDAVGDAKLATSGGSIHAKINVAANCVVHASAVWGRVESVLPLVIAPGAGGKKKLTGRLGQGGPVFTFHANGGHVKLTPGDAFIEEEADEPAGTNESQGASDLRRSKK